jgi:hypothetical protein
MSQGIGLKGERLTNRDSITYRSGDQCSFAAHPLLDGRHVLVQNRFGLERVRPFRHLRRHRQRRKPNGSLGPESRVQCRRIRRVLGNTIRRSRK